MTNKYIPIEILKINDIRRLEKRKNDILSYYYKHYSYFQNERSKIINDLKESLNKNCTSYKFKTWHRLISFKFSDNPLSSRGSLLDDPGGRFNIGDLDKIKYPSFPALYIAEDFETAYCEKFQLKQSSSIGGLTADELALNKSTSITSIIIDGQINTIIDITKPKKLSHFYEAIKGIKLPKELAIEAKRLKITAAYHVKSLKELIESIIGGNWRKFPMQVDIPSNSQIFGQIVNASNIEAILYPSKMRSKKKCLAIFSENFRNSSSYVQIKDAVPKYVKINCLNAETFHELI